MRDQRLVLKNECWFRKITPAVAKRLPKYKSFVGMFLVTESTDHLDEGAVVTDLMIYAEQCYLQQTAYSAA